MSYISTYTSGSDVTVWERTEGGRYTRHFPAPYYFYIEHDRGKYRSIFNKKLTKLVFKSYNEMTDAVAELAGKGIATYESDIRPELKVLAENYYEAPAPKLHVTFYDIENDYDPKIGYASVEEEDPTLNYKGPYAPVNAVALHHHWTGRSVVYAVPPPNFDIANFDESLRELSEVVLCKDEAELLAHFLREIQDTDCLSGWNNKFFDDPYMYKRIKMVLGDAAVDKLSFPNCGKRTVRERQTEMFGKLKTVVEFRGRISLDYMDLFRKYEMEQRASYKLEAIANEILPHLPKLSYDGSLAQLYHNDFNHFVRYNIRDTEILKGFEDVLGYVELANVMYHSATGKAEQVFGTIRLADLSIVNYCHNVLNVQVPDWVPKIDGSIQGAMVLYPQIGFRRWMGSIDINSLYPKSIESLNISPETLIGQFTDNIKAWEAIRYNRDVMLECTYETGEIELRSAIDWKEILIAHKWAISGYGTIFDQNKIGVLPSLLGSWYNQRKQYQKQKSEWYDKAQEITTKYPSYTQDKQMSQEDHLRYDECMAKYTYFDRLQYVYKIKLNSTYGALTNYRFRFFRLELGESTTGTGRAVLTHQLRMITKILGGKYDVDFPLYGNMKDAIKKHDLSEEVANQICLDGSRFNGKFDSESVMYGDSVAGDSVISVPYGDIHIQTLFTTVDDVVGEKEYCTTNLPMALTYNETTRCNTYRQIKYIMRHKCEKQMYRVWITNSQYIDVTEDHSLMGYINTRYRSKFEGKIITKVKPQELGSEINTLIYQRDLPRNQVVTQNLHPLVYLLMGYVLGDGHASDLTNGHTNLSVGAQDLAEVKLKLLDPLVAAGLASSYYVCTNGHDVQVMGASLRKLIRKCLYVGKEKVVPEWMFYETVTNIGLFLQGLFTADGYVNNRGVVGLCSVTTNHITAAQKLLLICCIPSTWFTESTKNSYKGKFSGTYTKKLTVRDVVRFGKYVGFLLDRKQNQVPTEYVGRKHCLNTYGFDLVNIHKIEQIEFDDYVYDIEVDDTHTFFANRILVHNTDSGYFETGADNQEDATIIADYVGDAVNKSFPGFMREAFLCQPGYDHHIKCGREVVSDRGILVDKKRYVLHLVDLDGKKCDKLKVMGLEMRKTTTPKPIQIFLKHVVSMILKDTPWDEVNDFIIDYRDKVIYSMELNDIGLPKGVKKVEEYTQKRILGKDEHGKKYAIPGHVSATIHFNQSLELYEDKENDPIGSDTKIRVYYLKKPIDGFKSIAIPTDIDRVPDWFRDNYEVDRALHAQKLVDNNLGHIFRAIGQEVPTHQTKLFNSLYSF